MWKRNVVNANKIMMNLTENEMEEFAILFTLASNNYSTAHLCVWIKQHFHHDFQINSIDENDKNSNHDSNKQLRSSVVKIIDILLFQFHFSSSIHHHTLYKFESSSCIVKWNYSYPQLWVVIRAYGVSAGVSISNNNNSPDSSTHSNTSSNTCHNTSNLLQLYIQSPVYVALVVSFMPDREPDWIRYG